MMVMFCFWGNCVFLRVLRGFEGICFGVLEGLKKLVVFLVELVGIILFFSGWIVWLWRVCLLRLLGFWRFMNVNDGFFGVGYVDIVGYMIKEDYRV